MHSEILAIVHIFNTMTLARLLSFCYGLFTVVLAQASSGGNATTTLKAIPIALGGKHPETAKAFIKLMLPEYDGTSHLRE